MRLEAETRPYTYARGHSDGLAARLDVCHLSPIGSLPLPNPRECGETATAPSAHLRLSQFSDVSMDTWDHRHTRTNVSLSSSFSTISLWCLSMRAFLPCILSTGTLAIVVASSSAWCPQKGRSSTLARLLARELARNGMLVKIADSPRRCRWSAGCPGATGPRPASSRRARFSRSARRARRDQPAAPGRARRRSLLSMWPGTSRERPAVARNESRWWTMLQCGPARSPGSTTYPRTHARNIASRLILCLLPQSVNHG